MPVSSTADYVRHIESRCCCKKLLASQLDFRSEISALQRQIEERVTVKRTLFGQEMEVQESPPSPPCAALAPLAHPHLLCV